MVELLALPALAYIAASDLRTRTIPDGAVAALALIGGAAALWRRLAVPALLLRLTPAALLLAAALRHGGLGGGDWKLFAALCLFCTPVQSLSVLLLALSAALMGAKICKRNELPFAPFLCGSFLLIKFIL